MINPILSIKSLQKVTASMAVFVLLIASVLISFAAVPAQAAGAPITGTLFTDFNRNGILETTENVPSTDAFYPSGGITVTAYDDLGNSAIGVVTSGANGVTYSVDPSSLAGTKFRLSFGLSAADKAAGWSETFIGQDSNSSVTFVNAGSIQNFGVIPPSKAPVAGTGADGNTNNSSGKIWTTQFLNGSRNDPNGPTNPLLALNFDKSGFVENLSTKAKLGGVWGLAYDEWRSNLFTSAYLKRHVALGPEGLDGLYWLTYPNETVKQVSLETLGGPSFGTVGTRDVDGVAYTASSYDATVFKQIAKVGIGDIDVSPDGKTLFVTNIAAKAIMAYDVSKAQNGTISYLGNYALTNADAACPNNSGANNPSDWYPFALEPVDGDSLYVGITCNAQSSQSPADLTAKVLELKLNPVNANLNVVPVSSTLKHSVSLNYNKDCAIYDYCTSLNQGGFHPWQDDYTKFPLNFDYDGSRVIYPTPVLSDINISKDGSMTLNILDRTTDQYGYRNYDPSGKFIRSYSGGDIIKVCNTSTPLNPVYLTEGVAGCKGTNPGPTVNNSSTEWYYDNYPGYHPDTTVGGAWAHPYLNQIVSGQFDPQSTGALITGGLSWLNTVTGAEANATVLYTGGNDYGFSGKANGIGDVEGAYVPVAIGDYVWLDSDGDGIQDPSEQPLAGVQVTITCPGLASITKITDANGRYSFDSSDGLVPGAVCSIKFNPLTATNLPAGITPSSLIPTVTGNGTNPTFDSNINSSGTLVTSPLIIGQVNNSYDAGFTPPIKAIDDSKVTTVNTPVTYCPLINDMAPAGSKITSINGITAVVGTPIIVPNGTVTLNADGCVTFTPNPGYVGIVTFPYVITAPNGQTSTAIDTITITGVGKVDLVKTGTFVDANNNGAAEVGETIKYTFKVINSGSLPLTNVKVTDNKCSPVLGGPIALAVGATDTTTFTCTYALTTADLTLGRVYNQATVTAGDPSGKVLTNTSDSTDPNKPGPNDPTVTPLPVKAVDDTKVTPLNTPINYCPLINDMVPAGSKITSINGVLATVGVPITVPNGTVTLGADGCVTFTPANNYVGVVTFPYEVTTPNGTKVTAIDTITITGEGKIELIKVGSFIDGNANGAADVGETIKYTFTVKNTGSLPLTNVKVTDNKCSPVLGAPIALAIGATDTTTFTCNYSLTLADLIAGKVDNSATATGTDPTGKPVTDISDSTDPNKPGSNDPTVTPLPVKAVDDTKVTPINTPITYCPLINDMVPAGSKITSINGITAVVGTPIIVPNGTVTLNADGCVTFTPNPGYVGVVTFPYEVTTPNGTVVKAIDTITITGEPKIELIKAGTFLDSNANGAAEVGETIKYTFTVKNIGTVALTNVKVTDSKCSPVLGSPIALAVGASDTTTFTCFYTLISNDIVAGKVDNQATATGTDPNGSPVTDLSDSTDPVKPGPNDPTVTPLPVKAVDDTKVTPVNTPIKYCPLINDMVPAGSKITGINGQPATVGVPITVPNGTVTLEADGCVTFTPNKDYVGVVTFPYEVTTPNGTKVTAIDTITITGEGKIELIKVGTFFDANGDGAAAAGETIKYTFTVKNTGSLTLTNVKVSDSKCSPVLGGPIATFAIGAIDTTTFSCIYTLTSADITAGKVDNSAIATGTDPTGKPVTDISDSTDPSKPGPNDPTVTPLPVKAVDDTKTTPVNTPITYCPLANDMVPAGTKITSINGVTAIVGTPIIVPNGTVTLNADGCVTFTPAPGYVGTVTFPYEVTTPNGTVVKAVDVITIAGSGSIELIKASVYIDANNDGAAQVGETIKYTFTVKNTGTLALTNVTVSDNKCSPVLGGPIALAVGASDTTTFTCTYSLTAADIAAEKVENSATVTGTDPTGKPVTDTSDSTDPNKPGPNDPTVTILPPKAIDDNKITKVNTPIKYCPLANDMVPPGSKITSINGVTAVVGTPITVPNGTVTLEADGCVTFTPAPGFVGVVTFPYEVTTPAGRVVSAIDTITIEDVPRAIDDTKETPINTPIKYCPLINDMVPTGSKITGINGQAATPGVLITVPNGTVMLDADGCVTFTPNPGYTGTVTFPYEVTTPNGVKVTAIDTITIVGAVDDTKTTPVNTPITYPPLVNDKVPTGSKVTSINNTPVVPGVPIQVPNGTITVNPDQSVTFTPNKDYVGVVTFPYEVTTPSGTVVKAIDTITIVDVSKALDDTKSTPENTPVTYCPLANDMVPAGTKITNINGQIVTVGVPINVPNGTVIVNADGCVTFTPAKDYVGTVSFPYEATTPTGEVVKAIDTITITPVSKAIDDTKVTPVNTPITYCPLANDMVPAGTKIISIDGKPVTVGVPVTVPNGTVTLNADGCVTFTPAKDYVGIVTFPYEARTPSGSIVKAIDTITINGEGKIELDKAATYVDANGDGKLGLGETVKYAFTIKNSGTTTLTNVTVTDTMPGIIIIGTPIPSMAPGAVDTTTYTATYIVTQADLDKGMVVNQATVSGKDPNGNIVKDLSNDPTTSNPNDPTSLPIPKTPAPTCNSCNTGCNPGTLCGNPCAGTTGCGNGCGNNSCMPISSISCITNTNTVTITGGSAPMISPVYNYNNVFNSNINFTQGAITFDFHPVTNNYYK
jgi:uncharacterized membrane protein